MFYNNKRFSYVLLRFGIRQFNINMGEIMETKPESIYRAIPTIMAEMDAIGKNQNNKQQHFKFRGIDDVYNELQKHMAKHGVFSVSEILKRDEYEIKSRNGGAGYRIVTHFKWTFFGCDGTSVTTETIGEAIDYGDKASNKSASIAHKYALLQIFCVPTESTPDPDSESHDLQQPPKLPTDPDSFNQQSEKFCIRFGKKYYGKRLFQIDSKVLLSIFDHLDSMENLDAEKTTTKNAIGIYLEKLGVE